MTHRSAELTTFLQTLHHAIVDRAPPGGHAHELMQRIMQALEDVQPQASHAPHWFPLCTSINDVVENVASTLVDKNQENPVNVNLSLLEHAQSLQALAPGLAWWRRADSHEYGEPFARGHANATVIGKGGLEERDDVWVGISLMAPGVQYPEHQHPPEEVYLVLSQGYWQKAGGDWIEPGAGGLVHNPQNIKHAMRSGPTPLLATWCLWNGASG